MSKNLTQNKIYQRLLHRKSAKFLFQLNFFMLKRVMQVMERSYLETEFFAYDNWFDQNIPAQWPSIRSKSRAMGSNYKRKFHLIGLG